MKRELWLDNIRWATVLLVLLYHVFYVFNSVGVFGGAGSFAETQYQDALMYLLYPWFMLLLFVVAGISARLALASRSLKEFIRSRTLKLLVPSTIGLFVFQWIVGFFNAKASGALPLEGVPGVVKYFIYALSGVGPLWFAQDLWLFSLVLALMVRLCPAQHLLKTCEKASPWLLLGISFLLVLGTAQIYADAEAAPAAGLVNLYRPHYYLMGFLSGYYIFSQARVQALLTQHCHWLGALAAASLIAYATVAFGCDYAAPEHLALPPVQLLAFVTVIAIVGLAKRHCDRSSKFATRMTRVSYGLYLLHYSVLISAAYLLTGGFDLARCAIHPALIYAGVAVAVFALTPLLYEIIRRIPLLRWCILGIKS